MLFHVCLVNSRDDIQPIMNDYGEPEIYSQADAVSLSKALSQSSGLRYQPRPIKTDDNWRAREQARFADGTYQRLPWDIGGKYGWLAQYIKPDTFPHVSKDKPGFVAFTASEEHGQADRQTRMRPGRWLAEYMGCSLSARDIETIANDYAAEYEPLELKFAYTPDEIETVYKRGPHSCMSHSDGGYSSSCHPTRVYGAGDLAIAYLEINERITARTLAWPKKKIYGRIYGDFGRLEPLLEKAGYECKYHSRGMYAFTGARLLRIEEDGGFIAPYLDGQQYVRDDGEHLIIDHESHGICCDSTDGLVGDRPRHYCEHCEEPRDEEDTYMVCVGRRTTETWCESCRNSDAVYCSDLGDYVREDMAVRMYDGEFNWTQWYFDQYGATCEASDQNIRADESIVLDDGTIWSLDYFRDHGITIDGRYYDRDDAPDIDEESDVEPFDPNLNIPPIHTPRPATPAERMAAIAAGQIDLEDFIRGLQPQLGGIRSE